MKATLGLLAVCFYSAACYQYCDQLSANGPPAAKKELTPIESTKVSVGKLKTTPLFEHGKVTVQQTNLDLDDLCVVIGFLEDSYEVYDDPKSRAAAFQEELAKYFYLCQSQVAIDFEAIVFSYNCYFAELIIEDDLVLAWGNY